MCCARVVLQIPYEVVGRRDGDAETVYADPTLAEQELGWKAKLGLQEMCMFALCILDASPNLMLCRVPNYAQHIRKYM